MKGKRESPVRLDLPFDEALRRFIRTDPDEVKELQDEARRKPPPVESPGKGAN